METASDERTEPEEVEDPTDRGALTRRRIYLQRLLGDDVTASRKAAPRGQSWHGLLRFLLYAGAAAAVILTRTCVQDLGAVNRGIAQRLERPCFEHAPARRRFRDVATPRDIRRWTERVLLAGPASREEPTGSLRLLSYNRVTPAMGVCLNNSAIVMTVRRVAVEGNYNDTTTARFHRLVPNATKLVTLKAGSSVKPGREDTGSNEVWAHTSPEACEPHCSGHYLGYERAGGYVAVITLGESASPDEDGVFFHLIDNALAEAAPDAAAGTCGEGLRASATFNRSAFPWDTALNKQTGSLAYDFTVYNANLQTMSVVSIAFNVNLVGLVSDKEIKVQTLVLSTHHQYMKYFEIFYLVGTLCYFLELSYRSWKTFPQCLKDVWFYINLISIVSSLTSLFAWYLYEPHLAQFRTLHRGFEQPSQIGRNFYYHQLYMSASAVAALTICLRILQFLSTTRARVMLLWRTLCAAARNIAIYCGYILVVLWGFMAFAKTHFAATSPRFATWCGTFLSCFEMFFGKTDAMATIPSGATPLKNTFYVLFMLCFYFISVQMFNAIVNCSYNQVSEEMEPQFARERNEKKRKELQARVSGTQSMGSKLRERFWKPALPLEGAPREEAPRVAGNAGAQAASAPAFESLNSDVKEKVEAYLNRDQKSKRPERPSSVLIFLAFAILYLVFLGVNLRVGHNYAVRRALETAIREAAVPWGSASGEQDDYIRWEDVFSIPHAHRWLTEALPEVIFNSTSDATNRVAAEKKIRSGVSDGTVCIASWNCLVWGREGLNGSRKILRITQRRARVEANLGTLDGDEPEGAAFASGVDAERGNQSVSGTLVAQRRSQWDLDPGSAPHAGENTTESHPPLAYAGEGCGAVAPGAGGFRRHGGIVCLLDADPVAFQRQMRSIADGDFFGIATGSVVVEFALYNANLDTVSYVELIFVVRASGVVERQSRVASARLLNLHDFQGQPGTIVLRILPGALYLILVFRIAASLYSEFTKERQSNRLGENSSALYAAYEFFIKDTFNLLECISIVISVGGAVLFIFWLSEEAKLKDMVREGRDRNFSELLFYLEDLCFRLGLYSRLSAINVLIIFTRPLKSIRKNSRIAKLNRALWEAKRDIYWFVIMSFITMLGFVMFTYVAFGPYLPDCSTFRKTFRYCFNYMLGNFDYYPLFHADSTMAVVLMPYLILLYCVFANIFFAIIDRFFITPEAVPVQWKQKLKPLFGRICRCIRWDEDYVVEQDPGRERRNGPLSRRLRAREAQRRIEAIRLAARDGGSAGLKRSRALNDVCEVDARMGDVLFWSRREAQSLVEELQALAGRKAAVRNDEEFIKQHVMQGCLRPKLQEVREEMEEAMRHMQYAARVHEQMAVRDQETLARYALVLEAKIKAKMLERRVIKTDVIHLNVENHRMSYFGEELTAVEGKPKADWRGPQLEDAETDPGSEGEATTDLPDGAEQSLALEGAIEEDIVGPVQFVPASELHHVGGKPHGLLAAHGAGGMGELKAALCQLDQVHGEDTG